MKDRKGSKSLLAVMAILLSFMLVMGAGPALGAEPLILKFSIWIPAQVPYSKAFTWITNEVEKRSKGRVKFEYYYSGSLVPARETVSGLQLGIADLAFLPQVYAAGKLPLSNVTGLPMTGAHVYPTCMAVADLFQMPELKAELARHNIRYLAPLSNSSGAIWSRSPIASLADLKGKKVAVGGPEAVLMKALGAVPVSIISTEIYTALERGTVDAAIGNATYAMGYKWQEPCRYYYALYTGNKGMLVAINIDSWNKIPADIQQMFTDLSDEAARFGHEIYEGAGEKQLSEAVAAGKVKITEPSSEDVALATKMAEDTVWKDWVNKTNEKGLPGKKVLDYWLAALEKWRSKNPFKK